MPSRRLVVIFATGLLALAGAWAVVASVRSTPTRGRAALPLPAEVLVGPRVTLASLAGKPAVVNFWASWCAPCRREAAQLSAAAIRFHGRAAVVGIDENDARDGAERFLARYRWHFPVLRDASGTTGDAFQLPGLPTTFILDAGGHIHQTLSGPQTVATLDRALSSVIETGSRG